jgi:hypothetical protein
MESKLLPSSDMKNRNHGSWPLLLALGMVVLKTDAGAQQRKFGGVVSDPSGSPIAGAAILTSGYGFRGWAVSKADGTFELPGFGAFVSFRHEKYKAKLVPSQELTEPVRVSLDPVDEKAWKLQECNETSSSEWVGLGLRVRVGSGYEGPVYGEHDAHWYVRRKEDWLHIVSGYAWHAGLPLEHKLTESTRLAVRGWYFEQVAGLDITGRNREGKYWRWVGAPVMDAIEYEASSKQVAEAFDRIISTMCFQPMRAKP